MEHATAVHLPVDGAVMNSTITMVTGNVATDIRFTTTAEGLPVASFRMAATERKYDRVTQRWIDGEVTWFSVVCWRHVAENCHASLRKGDPIFVAGRLSLREWERDGRTGTTLDITAEVIGHDLSRGIAHFERTRKHPDGESVNRIAA